MPLPLRLYAGDTELGKKDDDHKPAVTLLGRLWWMRPHGPQRRNLRRLALGALAFIGLYYFFKNMPTDLENPRQRPSYNHNSAKFTSDPTRPPAVNQGIKSGLLDGMESDLHDFNGPIKFHELATTLHAVSKTKGSDLVNRNILFAAASLKSAAILLPIACEMAMRERNFVHFALLGRDDISMDILKSVNGITKECMIIFHDARPDHSVHSSDFRMEVSCSAAFRHINSFVNPQATFVDGSGNEDMFFMKGLKMRATSLQRTIIDLPENAEQTLMWTTMLDSASLSFWNKINIDLVVHAPPTSSGSLIRLLESLKKADFFSSAPPRLTIELPHDVDVTTERYLEHFKWPLDADQNSGSLLTLHHRIPQHGLTPEENSIRFLEAFWPADSFLSHVLILSPQAELSPLFFHYLKYSLLEYRYSISKGHDNLLGISLDLPSTYLNDTTTFTPPLMKTKAEVSPFLWQAPSSNAALYFGDKWVELHDFVAHLLTSEHASTTSTKRTEKLVSKTYPSWLEHILKLTRARGYLMLYPNFENPDAFAALHNELYQAPEEYAQDPEFEDPTGKELTADPARHLSLKQKEKILVMKSLLSILPSRGELPKVEDMPLIGWDGASINLNDIGDHAVRYSRKFRTEIGGCDADAKEKPRLDRMAADLFCD